MPSRFPQAFDADDNLYLVHDALRVRLAEDYNPGDTTITIEDNILFDVFPPTGVLTLTEQCSDIEVRALSLSYTGKGTNTFTGLSVLDGFADVVKPQRITDVTLNVMALHHDQLKDALIAIETFAGVQGEISLSPLQGTMEARINYLRNLVLRPKSWLTVARRVGIMPFCVDFKDFSTREPDTWFWDFGDGNTQTITRAEVVQTGETTHCYNSPGIYDVSLTVTNAFGSDTVTMPSLITVRVEAPDPCTIAFIPDPGQIETDGVLRARVNTFITMLIETSGEQLHDPITEFVWDLTDDLGHTNSNQTVASYSIGGLYDVKVEAHTTLGAYRITTFEDVLDIVDKFSIWHMIFDPAMLSGATTGTLYVYEFGTLSETYKAANVSSAMTVTRDSTFLAGLPNEDQQIREFRRNNGFAPRSLTASGDNGSAAVFWAGGASSPSSLQYINFQEWNGFNNTWTTPILSTGFNTIQRQWNWVPLDSGSELYLILGSPGPGFFSDSPTNQNFVSLGLNNYIATSFAFGSGNYLNGADELMENVGDEFAGNFSVYRSTWKDSSGYMVRNDGTGAFFRLKSFYRTEGTISQPLQVIRKLTDMPGAAKFEGQMVALTNGIYFFNNTGEVLLYDPVANTWSVGGPGVNSPDLQDKTVTGYDNASNTLVATSDQTSLAYLFFDYSTRAQIKFNEADFTFTSLPVRPSGEQFLAGLY